jgi:hypothetical protein
MTQLQPSNELHTMRQMRLLASRPPRGEHAAGPGGARGPRITRAASARVQELGALQGAHAGGRRPSRQP